jgi:hypothetical protein
VETAGKAEASAPTTPAAPAAPSVTAPAATPADVAANAVTEAAAGEADFSDQSPAAHAAPTASVARTVRSEAFEGVQLAAVEPEAVTVADAAAIGSAPTVEAPTRDESSDEQTQAAEAASLVHALPDDESSSYASSAEVEPAFSAPLTIDDAPAQDAQDNGAPENGTPAEDTATESLPRTGGLFDDVPSPVAPGNVDPQAPRDEHRA